MTQDYRCPICSCHLEAEEIPENCPACKEAIGDKLRAQVNSRGGMNTSTAMGPGLVPLDDIEQTVY